MVADLFWKSHNPIAAPRSDQYKSAIWYADEAQLNTINSIKESLTEKYEQELTTEVLPLQEFYVAEDYHQKYSLQRHRNVMSVFKLMYSEFGSFVGSTAAARLNGFSARQGSRGLFDGEKRQYGIDLNELEKVVRF